MVLHQNPPVSWADLFYLSDSLLILAALLSFPLARRTRLERWKFLLDAAMVLVGGAVAIWYFSIRPTAGVTEHSGLVVTLLAFAYPLVGMLVLLGITTVILRRPTDGNRVAFGLIVGGDRHQRRRRPHLQPRFPGERRPHRQHHRRRLPALLRHPDRRRRALLPAAGAAGGRARDAAAPQPAGQSPALPGGGHHLRAPGARGDPALDRPRERARLGRDAGDGAGRGAAASRGAGERAAPRRPRRAAERGPVPLAGAALLRRHHRHPHQRHHAVRESVGQPGVRLRPLRDGGPADRDPAAPRRPRPGRDALRARGAGPPASPARSSGASASWTAAGSAPRSWPRTSPAIRPSAASCSTPAT